MFGAGDVRIENVPDARIIEPTDAVVTVTRACICGSDLWPYKTMEHSDTGRVMGHEAIGVVEAIGPDVRTIKPGNLVVIPFAFSDGTCVSVVKAFRRRAFTVDFLVRLRLPERRLKRCVFRRQTARCSFCPSKKTTP